MEKSEQTIPPGTVLREDGCICPAEAEKPRCSKVSTCRYDPRFPNANQTKHCYSSFVDYQRCARLLGDYPGCLIFYKCYKSLCPDTWWEGWYDQMEKGIFPKKIYPPSPIIRPDPKKMDSICLEEEKDIPEEVC